MRYALDILEIEGEARRADAEADRAKEGTLEQADWVYIARSWRLLAEHILAERTGGEFLRKLSVH